MEEEKEKKLPYSVSSKEEVKLTPEYPVCLEDDTTHRCYLLPYGRWVIGREDNEDPKQQDVAILTDDLCISRHHVLVKVVRNLIGELRVLIRDHREVKNHTHVLVDETGEVLSTDSDYDLYNQSELLMGKTWFIVHCLDNKDTLSPD